MSLAKFAFQIILTVALSGVAGAALFFAADYATRGVIA